MTLYNLCINACDTLEHPFSLTTQSSLPGFCRSNFNFPDRVVGSKAEGETHKGKKAKLHLIGSKSVSVSFQAAPLKDLPVNDEHIIVPPWKANSQQPAFTIHVDEAEEETQKRPGESKKAECEDVLAFNSALTLPEPRKPLVPLDYPMMGSFGKF